MEISAPVELGHLKFVHRLLHESSILGFGALHAGNNSIDLALNSLEFLLALDQWRFDVLDLLGHRRMTFVEACQLLPECRCAATIHYVRFVIFLLLRVVVAFVLTSMLSR